jgi:ABC-type sugar transport system ATPase subunit
VDEVLAVGDAEFQKKCLGKMGDVAKEGRTVLFVSHNMAAIQPMGEGFTVRMRVTARETVESFMAALAIADAMGTRLCGINSRDTNGAVFSLRAGEQVEVVCRVPRLNLLPGVYALNLGLQRTVSREALDYFAGALSFEVLPRDVFGTGKIPHGPGHMYLSSEWTAEG